MMQIRYVPVPGDHLPRGMQVVIAEGEGDLVMLVPESMIDPVLASALSSAVTAHARSRWVYVGSAKDESPEVRNAAS